jgi:hypothetical protein
MELMMNVNPAKCIMLLIAVSFAGFEVVLEFS